MLIILTVTMLFFAVACTTTTSPDATTPPGNTEKVEQTPTIEMPEYENEKVLLKNIDSYTIVYPSDYTDYRKQDVEFLQKVIKDVTGASIKIVSDLEEASGKEIIIASSKRKNGVEDAIAKFQNRLDYVVAVRNGNIVLGGNNFYADMRAIYDFINNTLGYNDIDDEQGDAKEEISGVNYHIYSEPPILLTASNYSVPAYTKPYAIRDMADARFNMAIIEGGEYNAAQMEDLIKWCARYEIFLIIRNIGKKLDVITDCPVIWSTLTVDEPGVGTWLNVSQKCRDYAEKYKEFGWTPFVNFCLPVSNFKILEEWPGLFADIPMICFDGYWGHNLLFKDCNLLYGAFEKMISISRQENKDVWGYIESYRIFSEKQNASKMLRWQSYAFLSLGAKNILYFQYGNAGSRVSDGDVWYKGSLVNEDFTKNESWFYAKAVNEEILRLTEIYNNYHNVGLYMMNALSDKYPEAYLESPYEDIGDIIGDCREEGDKTPLMMGIFKKNDNDKAHAFTLINMETLNDNKYETDEANYVELKILGDNVTFYRNGVAQEVEKNSDGYYKVNMANGYCWFVTVD